MDPIFWAGILIGGVVGLILQFASRPLERLLDRRLNTRIERQSTTLLAASKEDRAAIRDWLIVQLLEIALVGALAGVAAGVFFAIASFGVFSQVTAVIGQAISIIGAIMILRIAGNAIDSARLLAKGQTVRHSAEE